MVNFIVLADPRTGSTLMLSYLRCLPQTKVFGELLSTEINFRGQSPLDTVRKIFDECDKDHKCFKVMVEHLVDLEIPLEMLLRTVDASCVIIMYRENALDTFVSLQLALTSDVWYTETPVVNGCSKNKAHFEPKEFAIFCEEQKQRWQKLAEELPFDIQPIFVKYEDLVDDHEKVMNSIKCQLGICTTLQCNFVTSMHRQNPDPLLTKLLNPESITDDHYKIRFNAERIFETIMLKRIGVSHQLSHVVPGREPHCVPTKQGWFYRVAEPWVNAKAKRNVMDAMDTKNISSAGVWTSRMSDMLKEIFEVAVAIPCSNGYTALVCALQASHIKAGDEVICPTFTMVAVLNAILAVGAKPIFVDNAGSNDYNPSLTNFVSAFTEKTKAVIVTHTYGVPQHDLLDLCKECEQRNCILIEDISESAGIKIKLPNGTEKYLGTFGDFAIASMYANKLITSGDGGFIFAKDFRLNSRLVSLINHGFTRTFHFVHFESAINAKINGLGAAFACGILEDLDYIIQHRQWLASEYRKNFKNLPIQLMPIASDFDTPWVFGFQCQSWRERQALRNYLAGIHIETRNFFYPLHLQPLLCSTIECPSDFCHANELSSKGVYLPTHTNLMSSDITYISQAVVHFFNALHPQPQVPLKPGASFLRFQPNEHAPIAIQLDSNNCITNVKYRGHYLTNVVSLLLDCHTQLMKHFRWDQRYILMRKIEKEITEAYDMDDASEKELKLYLNFFGSQTNFEPETNEAHWKLLEIPKLALSVPTTTDIETIQLLMWLVQSEKVNNVLELGCMFGHTSLAMAIAAEKNSEFSLTACDAFKFQRWMTDYVEVQNFVKQSSFLDYFIHNVKDYDKNIKPVVWSDMFDGVLPIFLENRKFELVFVDSTQDANELEILFETTKRVMIPGKTIIVLNGVAVPSLPFITKYTNNGMLQPIYKPATISQAFVFQAEKMIGKNKNDVNSQLCIGKTDENNNITSAKYCFMNNPDWTHHLDAFTGIIDQLKQDLHSDEGEILFLPSAENGICNYQDEINRDWIGIIHNVPDSVEHFYSPSLTRLCNPQYLPWMKLCRGLICLTSVQAEYLEKHLLVKVPIQVLPYPFAIKRFDEEKLKSANNLIERLENEQEVINCVFVGSFSRNVDLFYNLKFNGKKFQKCMLIGDETMAEWSLDAPSDVTLIDRLDENDYEEMLRQSVIIAPLKCNGAANTIVLECIQRNTPIIINKFQSVVDYLGPNYPLYLDDHLDENQAILSITGENIKTAVKYLENMDKERQMELQHDSGEQVPQYLARSTCIVLYYCFPTSQSLIEAVWRLFEYNRPLYNALLDLWLYEINHNPRVSIYRLVYDIFVETKLLPENSQVIPYSGSSVNSPAFESQSDAMEDDFFFGFSDESDSTSDSEYSEEL